MSSSIRTRREIRQREALSDAVAGVVASLVALWTFYPIDVYKTEEQARRRSTDTKGSKTKQQQPIRSYSSTWRHYFFRGIHVKTLHTASSSFCYFYVYSWILSWWKTTGKQSGSNPSTPNVSTLSRLILSAIAAMINTTVTLPLDVISSNHQVDAHSEATTQTPGDNTDNTASTTMDRVWNEADRRPFYDTLSQEETESHDNLTPSQEPCVMNSQRKPLMSCVPAEVRIPINYKTLWKGLWPSLLLCSNPAIHYTIFDVLKGLLLQRRRQSATAVGGPSPESHLTMSQAFVLGLLAKFTATLATYPLIRAKILLMVTSQRSMINCLVREYTDDGIRGMYRGWQYQLLHTMLKSALLLMVRERISNRIRRAIVRD